MPYTYAQIKRMSNEEASKLTEHEKNVAYELDLKTNPLKPCVYLDNGGLRRMSYSRYLSEDEARKEWGNKFCYWPETNPRFYEENGERV